MPLIPLMEAIMTEGLAVARQELDEPSYAAAWAAGRAMPTEQGIAEAQAVEVPPPATPPVRDAPPPPGPAAPLSRTELQVLRLLADGRTTREIAAELVIAVSTADRHLTHIYQKLGVRNRAEATALAHRHGML
jgi:DNA-binding NarL/FixJ family response regulator